MCFILIFFISISVVSASQDFNETFNEITQDNIINNVNENQSIEELQNKIDGAYENSEIEVNGIYNNSEISLNISKSITLNGLENTTFDSEHITITSGNVILKNLNIINSNIYSQNSNLTIINCNFITQNWNGGLNFNGNTLNILNSNFKSDNGNLIHSNANNLIIKNSSFYVDKNNNAYTSCIKSYGDLIDIEDTAFDGINLLSMNQSKIKIKNIICKYETYINILNECEILICGNFYNTKFDGQNSFTNFTNCTFKNCEIYKYSNSNISFENCSIINSIHNSKSKIINSKYINNTINELNQEELENVEFINNTFLYPLNVKTVNNCSFINNSYDCALIEAAYSEITNSKFINNYENNEVILTFKEYCKGLITLSGKSIIKNNIFLNNTDIFLLKLENPKGLEMTNNIMEDNYYNDTYSQICIYPNFDWNKKYPVEFITNSKITNNFYGINLKSQYEINENGMYFCSFFNGATTVYLGMINNTKYMNLANLILEKNNDNQYCLKFVDENNNLVNMPTNTYSIKQGNFTIENIKVENGIGTFTSDEALFPNKTYILTKSSTLVNKAPANITISWTGPYYHDNIIISVKNGTHPIANKLITIISYYIHNDAPYESLSAVFTDNEGNLVIPYREYVYSDTANLNITVLFSADQNFGSYLKTVTPNITSMKITPVLSKIVAKYEERKYFEVATKEFGSYKNSPPWIYQVKIYKKSNNKLVDEDYCYGDEKGIFTYEYYKVGEYKVVISSKYPKFYKVKTKTVTLIINKAPTTVKALKISAKYKKTKYFKVTVKSKVTNKLLKNTYVKIKIDKKTYKIKTNNKGTAEFNTKNLKIGKHNVVISSGDNNYIMSAKSLITIKR